MDSSILKEGIDPITGKYKTSTLSTKDQARIRTGFVQGYANAPKVIKNEIDRMYKDAPEIQKEDPNGVKMGADMWYASKYAPISGKEVKISYTGIDDGANAGFNKELSWYIEHGVSPEDTGFGWETVDNGIRMRYKSTLPNSRGIWIETEKLQFIPKDVSVKGDVVLAQPMKINNDGTVTIGIMAGKLEPVVDQEKGRDLIERDEGKDLIEKDGIIYKVDESKGFTSKTTAYYDDVKDVLKANFPKITEAWEKLAKDNGWVEYGKKESVEKAKSGFRKVFDFGKSILGSKPKTKEEKKKEEEEEALDMEFLNSIGATIRK